MPTAAEAVIRLPLPRQPAPAGAGPDLQEDSTVNRQHWADTITRVICDVMAQKGLDPGSVTLESPVDRKLGLDSLDWAAVVVQIDDETGVDPFAAGVDGELSTVGDLVDLYAANAHPVG